jgi:uncharacterized membrane protein
MKHFINKHFLKISAAILLLPAIIPAGVLAQANIQDATCSGSNLTITSDPGDNACNNINKSTGTADNIAKEIINLMTAVVGILAVIMIIYAGFRYVSSGGSDDAIKGAKNTIIYAIIGLVVVALAQIIVHFVLSKTAQASFPCVNGHISGGPSNGTKCR